MSNSLVCLLILTTISFSLRETSGQCNVDKLPRIIQPRNGTDTVKYNETVHTICTNCSSQCSLDSESKCIYRCETDGNWTIVENCTDSYEVNFTSGYFNVLAGKRVVFYCKRIRNSTRGIDFSGFKTTVETYIRIVTSDDNGKIVQCINSDHLNNFTDVKSVTLNVMFAPKPYSPDVSTNAVSLRRGSNGFAATTILANPPVWEVGQVVKNGTMITNFYQEKNNNFLSVIIHFVKVTEEDFGLYSFNVSSKDSLCFPENFKFMFDIKEDTSIEVFSPAFISAIVLGAVLFIVIIMFVVVIIRYRRCSKGNSISHSPTPNQNRARNSYQKEHTVKSRVVLDPPEFDDTYESTDTSYLPMRGASTSSGQLPMQSGWSSAQEKLTQNTRQNHALVPSGMRQDRVPSFAGDVRGPPFGVRRGGTGESDSEERPAVPERRESAFDAVLPMHARRDFASQSRPGMQDVTLPSTNERQQNSGSKQRGFLPPPRELVPPGHVMRHQSPYDSRQAEPNTALPMRHAPVSHMHREIQQIHEDPMTMEEDDVYVN